MMDHAESSLVWNAPRRAAWLVEVRNWIDERLRAHGMSRTSDVETLRERPWSAVYRCATSAGLVYFKAASPGSWHEPALVVESSLSFPDLVPPPLAVDPSRGWLLTRDYGQSLRHAFDQERRGATLHRVLADYARMQIASADIIDRLIALGVPDRRVEPLPELLLNLVRDDRAICLGREKGLTAAERDAVLATIPQFRECCTMLASTPCAAALDHDDLHDDNIFVGSTDDRASRICDWGDANITHPFCSLLVTCNIAVDDFTTPVGREQTRALRDAYLAPWREILTGETSADVLLDRAMWVGHVVRALNWHDMLTKADAAAREQYQPNVATWLRLWLERRGNLT
jgi:hypothetical protein